MLGYINIREYSANDKPVLMELLALNTPEYFAPSEREDFDHYLDNEIDLYFVITVDSLVVGCGGINFNNDSKTGKISWDILHPEFQGKSLGTMLLKHRIDLLKSMPSIENIVVRTSQVAYKFYGKSGFISTQIEKDYWAKGFDLYYMELPTTDDQRPVTND
jgi:[ribosomal protein S18]-alanine N-acetyltransferase